jgi:RNA polymerase sigma-70 factor (ECF subfamily)
MAAYHSRREALLRFLTARMRSAEEAEDLLQELYLRLNRVTESADIRDPGAYIFRAAMNLARDFRRERSRTRTREGHWVESQRSVMGEQAIDDAPSPERAYDAKQRLGVIRAVVDELSPQCRRVFLLHKFEGFSHQEVADRMGISRSTVEKHMHVALRRLMERLDQ